MTPSELMALAKNLEHGNLVGHEGPAADALRSYAEELAANEFLAQSDRRVVLVVDYRAPGEATYDVRVRCLPQVAKLLGWPGLEEA